MTIDISKIKPGDKVTLVPLKVWSTDDESGLIYVRDHLDGATFTADQIAAHHPAPREVGVGDRVRLADRFGEVIGIDGVQVGVRWENTTFRTWVHRANLTLVEGDQ